MDPQIIQSEVSLIFHLPPFHTLHSFSNTMDIVWDLLKKKIANKILVNRPDDEFLLKFTDEKLTNFAEDHVLNTEKALKKQKAQKNVCCYCFHEDKIFTGYEDGLICSWSMPVSDLVLLIRVLYRMESCSTH